MRGISLDAKRPHFLVPESSLDLMPKGTQYLSAPRRIARAAAAPARFSSQCAVTMRGISIDGNWHRFSVPEMNSDLMLKGASHLSDACRIVRAVAKRIPIRIHSARRKH